jgi:hypothetical protein
MLPETPLKPGVSALDEYRDNQDLPQEALWMSMKNPDV